MIKLDKFFNILEINFLDSYDGENLSHLQELAKIDIGENGLFLDN